MNRISSVHLATVYTSTSRPTVELTIALESGAIGRACLPLGYTDYSTPATGSLLYQRVQDEIHAICARVLLGAKINTQNEFDRLICDKTDAIQNESIRAKVRFLVSLASGRACAGSSTMGLYDYLASIPGKSTAHRLPRPIITLISGGRVATTSFRVQALMIAPTGASSLAEAVRVGSEVYHSLHEILDQHGQDYAIGDEGGLCTDFHGRDAISILSLALDTVLEAIRAARYEPGKDVKLAIDFAASNCAADGGYQLVTTSSIQAPGDIVALCVALSRSYPILFFEDPLAGSHVEYLPALKAKLAGTALTVADDLLSALAAPGEARYSCDGVIVMPDRIGTRAQAIDFATTAASAGCTAIASHRSSDTEDTFIADFSAAMSLPFVKAGGMSGSERIAKYNQLLRLAERRKMAESSLQNNEV